MFGGLSGRTASALHGPWPRLIERSGATISKPPELLKRRTENRRRLRLSERGLIGCLAAERFC
jgi:hypothetical protein